MTSVTRACSKLFNIVCVSSFVVVIFLEKCLQILVHPRPRVEDLLDVSEDPLARGGALAGVGLHGGHAGEGGGRTHLDTLSSPPTGLTREILTG